MDLKTLEEEILEFIDGCAANVFNVDTKRLDDVSMYLDTWTLHLNMLDPPPRVDLDYILQCLQDEYVWCKLVKYINEGGMFQYDSLLYFLDPFFESIPEHCMFHKQRNTRNWELRRSQYLKNEKLMKFWFFRYIDRKRYECINVFMMSNVLPVESYQYMKSHFQNLFFNGGFNSAITNQKIEPCLWKHLFISPHMIMKCVSQSLYTTFDELCSVTWDDAIEEHRTCGYDIIGIKTLVIECLQNSDSRYIDRLTIRTDVLQCIIDEYLYRHDYKCLYSEDGIVKEIMLIDQFYRGRNINTECFNVLYDRVALYYSGITKSIPVDCIQLTLIPQIKQIREHTQLPNELCDIVMLYLHWNNSKSDEVLTKFLNQLSRDTLVIPEQRRKRKFEESS